jgi:hypothetical protein
MPKGGEKISFFIQNTAKFCKNWINTLILKKNALFVATKSLKLVIIKIDPRFLGPRCDIPASVWKANDLDEGSLAAFIFGLCFIALIFALFFAFIFVVVKQLDSVESTK